MITIHRAYPFLDEAVAYSNPENAEPGNPDGHCYRHFIFIAAETESGRRFLLSGRRYDLDEEESAAALAALIHARGEIDEAHWNETYEIYGSPAWERADRERQAAWDADPFTRGTVRDY